MPNTKRTSPSGERRRTPARGERVLLHPERLLRLFRRAGWSQRLLTLALLAVGLGGVWLILSPMTVRADHPDPPPLTVALDCPPGLVSAFVGRGGVSTPLPEHEQLVATHDALCAIQGRRRAMTGLLLATAGFLNAAALLEWARIRRRVRRRRRRQELQRERERVAR